MKDVAFHITDIAENSLRAGAKDVVIGLTKRGSHLTLIVEDNGCGMSEETLQKVVNPFYTTRTTRRIGLGVPFLIQSTEQTGGGVKIVSKVGVGTRVEATWDTANIDCPPLGDVATSAMILLTGNEEVNITFRIDSPRGDFSISTAELKETMGDIPLALPEVSTEVREIIKYEMEEIM